MCADFVAPQFQNPDFLGNYIRGQQAGMQAAAFPGQMQQQQQDLTRGQLDLDQLRMAMKTQGALQNIAFNKLNGPLSPGDAANGSNSTGGIQNGPQGSVSSQPPQGSSGYAASDYAGMIPQVPANRYSPTTMDAISFLGGNKLLEGMQANQKMQMEQRDAQMKVAQMKASGPLDVMDAVANSPNPSRMVMSNPSILVQWPKVAQQLGFDPVKDFDDAHVRIAATFGGNQIRTMVGLPARELPHPLQDINGPYGQHIQVDQATSKETEVTGQKPPAYEIQKRWNPTTGREEGVMVQTSPGGQPFPTGGNPRQASVPPVPSGIAGVSPTQQSGGLGQQATAPTDLGYQKPSDAQLKIATLANYARSSIPTMQKLEDQGYRMSPTVRAAVIDAATNDDPGKLSQWWSQEQLSHVLSSKDQQYMAALMPFLQAAGHDMSGARLTTSALRQSFESNIPVDSKDPKYMAQIANNRQQLYNGLLAGSGSASQMPEFKSTLGADAAIMALPPKNAQDWVLHKDARGNAAYVSPDGKQFQEVK